MRMDISSINNISPHRGAPGECVGASACALQRARRGRAAHAGGCGGASRRGGRGTGPAGMGHDRSGERTSDRPRRSEKTVPFCRFPSLSVPFGAHSVPFWRFGAPRLANFGARMSLFGARMSCFGTQTSQSGTWGKRPKVKGRRPKGRGGWLEVRRRTRTSLASLGDLVPDFTNSCGLRRAFSGCHSESSHSWGVRNPAPAGKRMGSGATLPAFAAGFFVPTGRDSE